MDMADARYPNGKAFLYANIPEYKVILDTRTVKLRKRHYVEVDRIRGTRFSDGEYFYPRKFS